MARRFLTAAVAAVWLMMLASSSNAGKFVGDLVVKALPDGTNLMLVEDFVYVDHTGKEWGVPKGTSTDGASIPGAFWSIVGAPFSGKFRAAAVIHDFYCETKHRDWRAVHRVFYDAMITSGVSEAQAKLMYYAVYRFGPRWEVTADSPTCPPRVQCYLRLGVGLSASSRRPVYVKKDAEELGGIRGARSSSIEAIEKLADAQLSKLGADGFGKESTSNAFYENYKSFPRAFDHLLSP